MKRSTLFCTIILASCFSLNCFSLDDELYAMSSDNPVSQQGYVSFFLHTDKTYTNGVGQENMRQILFELKGLARFFIHRSDSNVRLFFEWLEYRNVERGFIIQRIELPGPETYFFQFSWDSTKGLSDGYMNGVSLRTKKVAYQPWKITGQSTQIEIPPGPIKVTEIKVLSRYLPEEEILERVPEDFHDKVEDLHYYIRQKSPIDIDGRKGDLIYESALNNEESVNDWVMEGPGIKNFKEDKMILSSAFDDVPGSGLGHFNFWCPKEFPQRYIAEWKFELLEEHGCCVLLFSAKGINGEDIFDPTIAKRDGRFRQYISGDINSYLLTFFFNRELIQTARPYINLFKNVGNYEISRGPVAIASDSKGFHHLQLIKDGSHIQFLADGKVFLDFVDSGAERWGGPALKGGKIGLRHMAGSVAAYKNFRVWELK